MKHQAPLLFPFALVATILTVLLSHPGPSFAQAGPTVPLLAVRGIAVDSVSVAALQQQPSDNGGRGIVASAIPIADLFQAALDKALQCPESIHFWSSTDTVGASTIHNGRFIEFFVSDTPSEKTFWFRNTSGPQEEFPRIRAELRICKETGEASLKGSVYLTEGKPAPLPESKALEAFIASQNVWLSKLLKDS